MVSILTQLKSPAQSYSGLSKLRREITREPHLRQAFMQNYYCNMEERRAAFIGFFQG